MRNAIIVALGLVCAALILSAPADAQRMKITEVTGTVDVGNLPFDAEGNVRVAGNLRGSIEFQRIRVVGFTQPMEPGTGDITEFSNLCGSFVPGSRMCEDVELFRSLPPPQPFGVAWSFNTLTNDNSNAVILRCTFQAGNASSPFGNVCVNQTPMPVACCGF